MCVPVETSRVLLVSPSVVVALQGLLVAVGLQRRQSQSSPSHLTKMAQLSSGVDEEVPLAPPICVFKNSSNAEGQELQPGTPCWAVSPAWMGLQDGWISQRLREDVGPPHLHVTLIGKCACGLLASRSMFLSQARQARLPGWALPWQHRTAPASVETAPSPFAGNSQEVFPFWPQHGIRKHLPSRGAL